MSVPRLALTLVVTLFWGCGSSSAPATPPPSPTAGGGGTSAEPVQLPTVPEGGSGYGVAAESTEATEETTPPTAPITDELNETERRLAIEAALEGAPPIPDVSGNDTPTDSTGDATVLGGLRGGVLAESAGFGGLGLRGTGQGGGGTSEGTIGLGNLGTIGRGRGQQERQLRVRAGRHEVSGALSAEVVRRVIRRHRNEVRFCYEQGLSRDADLQGRIVVRFTITRTGSVSESSATETFDTGVSDCVAGAFLRWTFPSPDDGGNTLVTYPFVFSTSSGPAAAGLGSLGTRGGYGSSTSAPSGPRVRSGSSQVQGPMSREIIRRVIRRHRNEVRECYERRLAQDPSLSGRIVARFTIGSTGEVTNAEARETFDTEVSKCLNARVRSWRFPAPTGGGIVVVTYPFMFSPGSPPPAPPSTP